jgi:hypothetical protein
VSFKFNPITGKLDLVGSGIVPINDAILKDGSVAMEADLDLDNNKIINLADPTANQDAATKKYVDDEINNINTDNVSEGVNNLYFTNERAQDSIGLILTNSNTINFSYDSINRELSAELNENFNGPIILNDNQVVPETLLSWPVTEFKHAIIDYSLERNEVYQTGVMIIAHDAQSLVGFTYNYVETSPIGVEFDALIEFNNLIIKYTTTNNNNDVIFKYKLKRWL